MHTIRMKQPMAHGMVLFVATTVIVLEPSAAAAVQEVTDPAY